MSTVSDILKTKGSQVWSIDSHATLKAALVLMAEKGVGALPVLENNQIVGIFSERDFARHAAKAEKPSMDTQVRQLMARPVYFVHPHQTIEECMKVMTAKHIRHLPVLEDRRLAGLISIGDVVKHLLAEKDSTIQSLEHFLWVNLV